MGVWGRTSPSPLIPWILEAVACVADIEWRCGGGEGKSGGGVGDPLPPFSPSPLLLRLQDNRVSWAGLREEVFVVIILTKFERIAPVSSNIDGTVAWKLTFQEKKKTHKTAKLKGCVRRRISGRRFSPLSDGDKRWPEIRLRSRAKILESFKFEDENVYKYEI